MTTYTKMLVGYKADYSRSVFTVLKGGLIAYKNGSEWIVVDKLRSTKIGAFGVHKTLT
ncbi:MAG: hypothetical protein LBF71_05390 [Campylobacteraceae bacterium]|jgi:hypothetical protein|nr:hypothetical protein [Campylobacteraceae bacterium]